MERNVHYVVMKSLIVEWRATNRHRRHRPRESATVATTATNLFDRQTVDPNLQRIASPRIDADREVVDAGQLAFGFTGP